jgi:hypothetical protein
VEILFETSKDSFILNSLRYAYCVIYTKCAESSSHLFLSRQGVTCTLTPFNPESSKLFSTCRLCSTNELHRNISRHRTPSHSASDNNCWDWRCLSPSDLMKQMTPISCPKPSTIQRYNVKAREKYCFSRPKCSLSFLRSGK